MTKSHENRSDPRDHTERTNELLTLNEHRVAIPVVQTADGRGLSPFKSRFIGLERTWNTRRSIVQTQPR